MDADETAEDREFDTLGWYSPRDAERLLSAFELDQIAYRTEVTGGTGTIFVQTDYGLVISVEKAGREKAHELHAELFGDALANFDSGFFRDDPHQTTPTDDEQV